MPSEWDARTVGKAKRDKEERKGRHPQSRIQCRKRDREEHERSDDFEYLEDRARFGMISWGNLEEDQSQS